MSAADRFIARITRRPPDFLIGGAESPYIRRWWVIPRNRFFNVYLHEFLRSDDDRAHHDHPWLFNVSAILRGGYAEHTIGAGGTLRVTPRLAAIEAELAASADAGKLAEEARRLSNEHALAAYSAGLRGEQLTPESHPQCAAALQAIDRLAALSRPAPATTAPVSAQGDERAAFEALMRPLVGGSYEAVFRPAARGTGHGYAAGDINLAWLAWQAARAQVAQGDEVDAARLDALQNAGQRDGWIVAKNVGSFTVYLERGHHATRKTLREALDAARAQQGGQR